MNGTHLLKRGNRYLIIDLSLLDDCGECVLTTTDPREATAMDYEEALNQQSHEIEEGYNTKVVPVPPYLMMERTGQKGLFDEK